MRALFVSRSYPPAIGGMARFSYSLGSELEKIGPSWTIANGLGKRALPLFLPYSLATAVLVSKKRGISLVHLGDALMAPLGLAVKKLTGLPVTVTVHGLDLTFDNVVYQAALDRTLYQLDRIMAVSSSTRDICLDRWPRVEDRVIVIPNGVENPGEAPDQHKLSVELEKFLNGKRVLLTVGRLVERKGVRWFVRCVLSLLDDDTVLVVAGEGAERESIKREAVNRGLEGRLLLLGRVSVPMLDALFARADIFVMPNIVVPNDVEGFGLVALEAAARGLPVVAADLQGIPEAIHDGANGFLVKPGDEKSFAAKVQFLLHLNAQARCELSTKTRSYTVDVFSWRRTAEAYWREFETVAGES
jgi:phosphatidyl-myo-inositol dimannoside synthase